MGRDQVRVSGGVTLDEFQALLREIRQALPQAGLEPDILEVINADFRLIEEQTQKGKPNKAIVVSKLKSISEMLKAGAAAATLATAGVKLAPLIERAIQLAGQLF